MYASDLCLASRDHDFQKTEEDLNNDMAPVADPCRKRRLKPSTSKTTSACFHLHDAQSQLELNIFLNGQWLARGPKSVGVTFDCTLIFTKIALKIKSRNCFLNTLAGFTWGPNVQTRHRSGLTLCYSAGKYCAPVWPNPAQAGLVETQPDRLMRIVTGTRLPIHLH